MPKVLKETSALSHLFRKSHFDHINKFVEAHSYHFTLLDSLQDNITDTDDDSDLVAEVGSDTLICIVRTELKNGKAPGIDNVYVQHHSQEGNKYKILQSFGPSLYHIIKIKFHSICLEGSSPLYAHYPFLYQGGSSRTLKGFSLITFEQNKLETSNFA